LSSDKQVVKDAVNALTATGSTYIPGGLAWGWRVVSSKEPFAESQTDGGDRKKYVVLMSDGANTLSPNYPDHKGSDVAASNTLLGELCSNMKADKVEIFTIAFEVTDSSIKSLLQTCASAGGAFYDAVNASELEAAFAEIGNSLTQIRLAK
jgi:Mg-chelatase subunit ChlD